MKMNKWKEFFQKTVQKLAFLKPGEDVSEEEEELQVEEKELSSGSESVKDLPEGDLRQKLKNHRIFARKRRLILLAAAACVILGFYLYNSFYQFHDYIISNSYENTATSGTQYLELGNHIVKYNSDGVSYVTTRNEQEWSITYSMQSPIADVCGSTVAIAEQQGTQVYVVNEDGLVGNFETTLPILKVRVSRQGVVAVVLQEEDVTWVNMFQADGTAIVNDKTTVSESGYPIDVDISPNGERLMVSYLEMADGTLKSNIVFYHFGAEGESAENHIVSSTEYEGTVVPIVTFCTDGRAIAVRDDGFTVFNGENNPKAGTSVEFDEEIVSCFYDESYIGFLFNSEEEDYDYRMKLYTQRGRKKAECHIQGGFDEIKLENGQILVYSDSELAAYTTNGRLKFSSPYEKAVEEFFYLSEFRRYLVITGDSFDRIRIV